MPVTALLLFGGETLKDFAFALLVGIASGTYSSIFIAAPVLTEWKEREPAYRQRRRRIEAGPRLRARRTRDDRDLPRQRPDAPERRPPQAPARAGAASRRTEPPPDEAEAPVDDGAHGGRGADGNGHIGPEEQPAPVGGAARSRRAARAARAERAERKKQRARQRTAPQAREKRGRRMNFLSGS